MSAEDKELDVYEKKVCNERLELIHVIVITVMLLIVAYSLNIRIDRGEFPYAEICYIILYYIHLFVR